MNTNQEAISAPVKVYRGYTPNPRTISGSKCVQMKCFALPLTLSRAVLRFGPDKIPYPCLFRRFDPIFRKPEFYR